MDELLSVEEKIVENRKNLKKILCQKVDESIEKIGNAGK